jgi:hypothetical protein
MGWIQKEKSTWIGWGAQKEVTLPGWAGPRKSKFFPGKASLVDI